MNGNKYRVNTRYLRKNCKPSIFNFESTAEIKPLTGIIGQDRAVRSVSFGLDIDNNNYNIYLAGTFGTGKTSLARGMLEKKAIKKPVPSDWCYVYNFRNPGTPKAIELPAGMGKEFKKDVSVQIDRAVKQISKGFESEDFEFKKNDILNSFVKETNVMYMQLEELAHSFGFSITKSQNGITTVPLKENGEVLNQEEYLALPEAERSEIMRKSAIVQEKLNEAFRQYKDLEKFIKAKIKDLEKETARAISVSYFAFLVDKYRIFKDIVEYLEDMQQDLLANVELFVKQEEENVTFNIFRNFNKRTFSRRYQVNLIVDNSELKHAPIVFETDPTYSNLFGQIEYEGEFGVLATDFSKIKAGSVHQANGGYLVLHVNDIIKNYYIWETLKKILENQEIKIENFNRIFGLNNVETLEPEPIPVKLKVILIGEALYYYLLHSYDEEFRKLFKIRADFDMQMDRTRKHINEYAKFISCVCENEKLRHFNPEAVAAVVDYGSRMADDQNKLTTLFNKVAEIIYEANEWANYDNASIIGAEHVKKAISEKTYRLSMLEERIQELIKNETLMINVEGEKIGEINGLAIYQMGDHVFGKPFRITAKTFMGEKGLVNIEREVRLSGTIHSKGILTLNGYLGAQYAQDKNLSLSASITFEQSYQGVEGDSASAAELCALISSLAGVPIFQGIAMTGSVNQNGEIQPVGGVNQKIEGFFRVCQNQGLDGKQGVVIPRQNISNLMLDEEVVIAVKNRKFNIWAIKHINEGLEILTGITAGERDESGKFTPGSIHDLVDNKLKKWNYQRRMVKNKSHYSIRQNQSSIRRRRR